MLTVTRLGNCLCEPSFQWQSEGAELSIQKISHDPDMESAYRAGYVRGVVNLIASVAATLQPHEREVLDRWVIATLRPWSRTDLSFKLPPPTPPAIRTASSSD